MSMKPRSRYAYSQGKVCQDCAVPVVNKSSGRCLKCYNKNRRGTPYKTGRNMTTHGYVALTGRYGHPNEQNNRGIVLEHIFVMVEYLGRGLLPHENVHHKNGDRTDNRLENLELWSSSQPKGQRVEDKVKWAKEILALYEDTLT